MLNRACCVVVAFLSVTCLLPFASADQMEMASISLRGPLACTPVHVTCDEFDAIVFVHGIYGGADTFVNESTRFDWPSAFPRYIRGRYVDVYTIDYESALFRWARGNNPDFETVANEIYTVMAPLRKRHYRSIGFIAHSLGGNVVSTYLHMVKTTLGHPQRSQHAYDPVSFPLST